MKLRYLFFSCLLLFNLLSCSHSTKPERSFYFWKTTFRLSPLEKEYLNSLKITKLYIRFFDVDTDETTSQPVPRAAIKFNEKVPQSLKVVPVIYILNKTLHNLTPEKIDQLADNIFGKINLIAKNNHIEYKEIQFDCDWTESTRVNYFLLLKSIRNKLDNGLLLSATIRLHQIKYKNITGIPPVDRGMLMYYNMGKITADLSPNSIYNPHDAGRYIDNLPDYPLPLDAALPSYFWGIHIRNKEVIGVINQIDYAGFSNSPNLKRIDPSVSIATQPFFFHGYYFQENDQVKIETISPEQCLIAAQQLKSKLTNIKGTLAIYHLDSLILTTYEKKDFEKVFDIWN